MRDFIFFLFFGIDIQHPTYHMVIFPDDSELLIIRSIEIHKIMLMAKKGLVDDSSDALIRGD